MDVEKIQRINNLAVELEKQGLAHDREDAVSQARRIFNVDDSAAINQNDMHEGSLQPREESGDMAATTQSTQTKLTDKKIEQILERNTKFLVSTIKKFEEKILTLESELANVKSRIHTVTSQQTAPVAAPAAPAAPQNTTEAPTTGSTNPQGGAHPRSGGYNTSDVSIEKFFYMGHK